MAPTRLKDLKVNLGGDTSKLEAGLGSIAAAFKLSDDVRDVTGRRVTAVAELIAETIAGDASLAAKAAQADRASGEAWEAIANDLARQVIEAEAIEAEWDLDDTEDSADYWSTKWLEVVGRNVALAAHLREEEQAHCDTYLEAVRLTAELAPWRAAGLHRAAK